MERKPRTKNSPPPARQELPDAARSATWKLEDAKTKFSEVVRRAQDQGPQYVTVRGKPAVAIVDVEELRRLSPPAPAKVPLVDFLEGLELDGLDLNRERDFGRDPAL